MNLYFQEATKEDIIEISRLYSAAIGTEGCTWSSDYPNAEITQGDFERDDLFCIKTDEGELVGAISVDDDKEVEVLSCWSKDLQPAAELARLVVKEGFQNQSIARRLLSDAMEVLKHRGYRAIHFLVSPGNERALRSYAKLAFTHCGDCDLYDHHWYCYEKAL